MPFIYLFYRWLTAAYVRWCNYVDEQGIAYSPFVYSPFQEIPPEWHGGYMAVRECVSCAFCAHPQTVELERSRAWPEFRRYAMQCANCGKWSDETDWQKCGADAQ